MISYKASVAQKCVLLRFNDLQFGLYDRHKSSVAQICVLFRFNDRQWSPTKPRSLKYVPFFRLYDRSMISYKASVAQKWFLFDLWFSMIVNDLLQSLGCPNMCLI